ncbi:hypothetical protein DMENIID0001_025270 [Sergentomyia squamirostris]
MFKKLLIITVLLLLEQNVCGERLNCGVLQRSANVSSATDNHVPWHVGIYSNETEKPGVGHELITVIKCGGTIINETTVITNARCLWNEKYGHIGSTFDYFVGVGKKQELLQIRRIHVLRGYMPSGDYFKSIALLELREPLKFEVSNVNPICLDLNGTDSIVKNWTGFVIDVREEQQILKFASLTVVDVPQEDCTRILPGDISRDKFCVRPIHEQTTSCNGDDNRRSGSGLFDAKPYNGTQKYFLRGIVTFSSVGSGSISGRQCSGVIVATKTSNYASFILGY